MRFCGHQVAYEAAEGYSLTQYSLWLCDELSIDGLASANTDSICFVETGESVSGKLTVEARLDQFGTLEEGVGCPSLD